MAKRTRPTIKPKIEVSTSQQESLLEQLQQNTPTVKTVAKKVKQPKIRFTMDLPKDMHSAITERADDNGQTMKGYILRLVKRDLAAG